MGIMEDVLQLQLFSQIFKILDLPFNLILPRIVWIPKLCLSFATNLDFLEFELRSSVYHCQKSNDSLTIFFPLFQSLNKLV